MSFSSKYYPAAGNSHNTSVYTDNNIPPHHLGSQSSQLGMGHNLQQISHLITSPSVQTDQKMFDKDKYKMMTPTVNAGGPYAGSLSNQQVQGQPHLHSKSLMRSRLEEILD